MRIVLDASAAVYLVVNDVVGREVAESIRKLGGAIFAPEHFLAEVGHGLSKCVGRRECDADKAWSGLVSMEREVTRVELSAFMWQAWQWREHETIQDMLYVAVAQERGATLVTCDREQSVAAAKVAVPVEHILSKNDR